MSEIYFIDTEFNGFNGELITLALVPEDESKDHLYIRVPFKKSVNPWVKENVMPIIGEDVIPYDNIEDAARAVAWYLCGDEKPHIIADWPEDIKHLTSLIIIGPGQMVPLRRMSFEFWNHPEYIGCQESAIPHNALEDAKALRKFWKKIHQ